MPCLGRPWAWLCFGSSPSCSCASMSFAWKLCVHHSHPLPWAEHPRWGQRKLNAPEQQWARHLKHDCTVSVRILLSSYQLERDKEVSCLRQSQNHLPLSWALEGAIERLLLSDLWDGVGCMKTFPVIEQWRDTYDSFNHLGLGFVVYQLFKL